MVKGNAQFSCSVRVGRMVREGLQEEEEVELEALGGTLGNKGWVCLGPFAVGGTGGQLVAWSDLQVRRDVWAGEIFLGWSA